MQSSKILIVDDEPDIRELLEITLSRMGHATLSAATLTEARNQIQKEAFALCLTDLRLPDGSGIDLVQYIQQHNPLLPVAVITAYGSMESAIAALKAGAFDFIVKPVDLPTLRNLIESGLRMGNTPHVPIQNERRHSKLLGNSASMQKIRALIEKLARGQAPVFVHGESGTGKELIAHEIHNRGPRRTKPFIPVNCGAIPVDLLESEFFGHLKGSFTGATADKMGLFQAADGGTLFLDEVADLSLPMQVKLLRAIQERRIKPIGSAHELPVDIRIISASHKNLSTEVAAGNFRQDLYYRLVVIDIEAPPLREHKEDLPLLCERLLTDIAHQRQTPKYLLDSEAMHALKTYSFPGNVRELENILERAATLSENQHIHVQDLNLPIADFKVIGHDSNDLENQMLEQQKQILINALEETRWNKTEAAKKLGLSFRQIRYRIKKFGIC